MDNDLVRKDMRRLIALRLIFLPLCDQTVFLFRALLMDKENEF